MVQRHKTPGASEAGRPLLDGGVYTQQTLPSAHDARRLQLEGTTTLGGDVAETVDRVAERVDDTAEVAVADGDRQDLTGAGDLLAGLDTGEVAEHDDTDLVLVEVQREALDAVLEADELVRHDAGKTLDVGDAVGGVDDRAHLGGGGEPPSKQLIGTVRGRAELAPALRNFAQDAQAGAGVLAAFGVVGAEGQHRMRPLLGPPRRRRVKFLGRKAEMRRVAAHLVERQQPGVAVKGGVLGSLGGHGAGELLELEREIGVFGPRALGGFAFT